MIALWPRCSCGKNEWFTGDKYLALIRRVEAAGWRWKAVEGKRIKWICKECRGK